MNLEDRYEFYVIASNPFNWFVRDRIMDRDVCVCSIEDDARRIINALNTVHKLGK